MYNFGEPLKEKEYKMTNANQIRALGGLCLDASEGSRQGDYLRKKSRKISLGSLYWTKASGFAVMKVSVLSY